MTGREKITHASKLSAALRFAALASALSLAACQSAPMPAGEVGGTKVAKQRAPAVAPDQATFAFEPFTGAPGNAADELANYIGGDASNQGLTLVRRAGAPASYRINGYLSAAGDQSSVTLFYVFDVIDAAGNRVHRIVGQESGAGTSGDPWSGVNSETLRRAAQRTVTSLRAWLYRGK